MYKEYAIDPTLINSFDRARALLGVCGWYKGKVVCAYPKEKNWKRKIIKNCNCLKDREKSRMIEWLKSYKTCTRLNYSWLSELSWLESALEEHKRMPFAAVLTNSTHAAGGYVLDGRYVTEDTELWCPGCGSVSRQADAIAQSLSLLLENSKKIVFIDPYFDVVNDTYKKVLKAVLKLVRENCYVRNGGMINIQIHVANKNLKINSMDSNIIKLIDELCLEDIHLEFCCWKDINKSGERLHDRYIMTELGGVNFGHSLFEDKNSTNTVTYLNRKQHKELLEVYSPSSNHFESTYNFDSQDR
jgi:hypothetical protein